MRKPIDLSGQRFGRWMVLNFAGKQGRDPIWNCRCDCGEQRAVRGANVKNGRSRSCGCLKAELFGNRVRTHGKRYTVEYHMWRSAKDRAAKKGLPFEINPTDIPSIPRRCPYLGVILEYGDSRGPIANSPSLDRIRPEKGYVRGNLQILSHKANSMKHTANIEEFEMMARLWRSEEELRSLIG